MSHREFLVAVYKSARDHAASLVAANETAASSNRTSGTGHKTPFAVPDAVRAWHRAAIDLAEHELSKVKE